MKKQWELMREQGKALFYNHESDKEARSKGLNMLCEAQRNGDPEAMYIVSTLLMAGVLRCADRDSFEHALGLMLISADKGHLPARASINYYCEERYRKKFGKMQHSDYSGPLLGSDGKVISFAKKGLFTPVDAVLEYKDGKNVLAISANVTFLYTDSDIRRPGSFEKAVLDGMKMWQGEYEVFGGQKITVEVNLTSDMRVFDTIFVMPVTSGCEKSINAFSDIVAMKSVKNTTKKLLKEKRSFFSSAGKWTTGSRKCIYMQSADGNFDDYEALAHTAKHEFGHVLGLGDLYESKSDFYDGVEFGTYEELDCYAVSNKIYNLVMCDSNGPVSNNDIEMVILAYKENKMQIFQKMRLKDEISKALGAGN